MPQAVAALARLLMQYETTYRTAPSPAAAKVLPFTTWNVGRNPRRQVNNTVTSTALRAKSDRGDPIAGGNFTSVLELRTLGFWLKLLLGAPTTGKAVTVQPVNVTGVTVNYAESACPTGAGTLTYTHIGTTLTWAAQGQSAGTAVNVSAGGNFTLQSSGANSSINVWVAASALPGANQNDATIAVSGTLKAHAFPHNLTARPSALFELQESDISKYYRTLGGMLNRLSWDVMNQAQDIAGDLIAAYEVDPVPGSAFDASPTSYSQARACSAGGIVSAGGGATIGQVVGGSIEIANNMTGHELADGLEGVGVVTQGELDMKGRIRTVFDGAGAYQMARDGTSSRLRLVSSCPVGSDTFALAVDMPNVEFEEPTRTIEGKSGLFVDMPWMAHAGTQTPTVVLVNDVTAY